MIRPLIRRIVDGVADGQKCHLTVTFSDGTFHDSTRIGVPDVTIVLRNRRAEWRMALRLNACALVDTGRFGPDQEV